MNLPAPPRLDPTKTALFLDIDGTLAEFEARPDDVGPDPARDRLLRALARRFQGRVAAVSGRGLRDIDRILQGSLTAVSGVHGLERRRADGVLEAASPHPAIAEARAEFENLVEANPALFLEDKGLGLVLHYRTATDLQGVADACAEALAERTGLALQRGDRMIEVRNPGRTKGDAVRAFMEEPPFQGSAPVFVGDDLTDESAFEAAAALRGFGVLVGPPRSTAAACRLDNVAAVLSWLAEIAIP